MNRGRLSSRWIIGWGSVRKAENRKRKKNAMNVRANYKFLGITSRRNFYVNYLI